MNASTTYTTGQTVVILKGQNSYKVAKISEVNTDYPGGTVYSLVDPGNGQKIWNGQFTYFSEDWLRPESSNKDKVTIAQARTIVAAWIKTRENTLNWAFDLTLMAKSLKNGANQAIKHMKKTQDAAIAVQLWQINYYIHQYRKAGVVLTVKQDGTTDRQEIEQITSF